MILLTLDEMGETAMNDLATRLVRDKSQMTRSIRVLEEKGLVRREVSQEDARVHLVALTDKGQQVVATAQRELADSIGTMLSPLSEADIGALKGLLDRAVGKV